MGSISGHIKPLVINSLEEGYTHAHTHTRTHTHTHTHPHIDTRAHTPTSHAKAILLLAGFFLKHTPTITSIMYNSMAQTFESPLIKYL